jgi:GNAT superfamily N-acetyltransferase
MAKGLMDRIIDSIFDEYQLQLPDKSVLQKKLQELINMPILKMEKSMVREAEQRDLDAILELYLFLHEDSIPKKDEHLRDTWLQIIQDPNHHLIVNEVDGKIVSSCVCVIIPNLTRNIRPYAFVENVVTREDYRGKGYAGECLEFAREIAEKENCYKMMLLTGSKKPETLRFYEKAGYNSSDKTAFIQWLGMDK